MNGRATGAAQAPQLYLIAVRELFDDDGAWLQALERVARAAASVHDVRLALQVRFEPREQGLALAQEALRRLRATCATLPLWLNARAGVQPLGYDGVHLPEVNLSASAAGGPGAWGGIPWAASVHSAAALHRAAQAGATFAVFGTLWEPQWKPAVPIGVEALRALTREATLPVVAIGGVTPERVGPCLRAGAAGVAVASGIFRSDDVQQALMAYAEALARG